ncbi:MAG: hypothetical protein ACI8R1_001707, partial [Psychrobacter glaciei]
LSHYIDGLNTDYHCTEILQHFGVPFGSNILINLSFFKTIILCAKYYS